MYKRTRCLFSGLVAHMSSLLIVVGVFLLATGLHSQPVEAAVEGECRYYFEVISTCNSDAILALWEDEKGVNESCVEDAVRWYYSGCFRSKLDNALRLCDLKLFLKEEAVVNNFKGQSIYPVMREMVRHNKCNIFVGKCLGKILDKAIEQDDWQTITEVEKLINSEELKNCGSNSKLAGLVKKAKNDYFDRWVSQKMVQLVKVYDLEEIYKLETFIYKEIQDSPDFPKMLEKFLDLKCRNLDNILEHTLGEAITDCDLKQIQDVEDILLFKWKRNCLGYDYKAMENSILQAKQSYMNSCLQADLRKYIDRCDLGRILELAEVAESYNAQDIIQEISAKKCLKLTNCWEGDLKFAVDTCNDNRFQELEELLDSSFSECDNSSELKSLLKQKQQTFSSVCQADAEPGGVQKDVAEGATEPVYAENKWISKVNSLIDNYKSSPKDTFPLAEINKIISREFEKNILLPPLLNENHTAYNRQAKFVNLIKTMLDVRQKLEYDRYLDNILEIITAKIFGVAGDKKKIILSEAELKRVEKLFEGMDKELRAALSELNDPEATYKFYTKLYFPLIKIDGLLNYIYEYNGQQPFVYFIDSLDKKMLEASFSEFLKFTKSLDFVNAETPFSEWLVHYYTKRGKKIWRQPDLLISRNINLPVFINVLKAQEGRLSETYDFKAILNNLLVHIDNKRYLIKKVNYEDHKVDYYDNMFFFDFIYNDLLIPLEIKTFPLRDETGRLIPLGRLVDEKNKIFLGAETRVGGRDKVDGKVRQMFLDKIINFRLPQVMASQEMTTTDALMQQIRQQIKDYLEKKVSVAIFLPNSQYNNAGQPYDIEKNNKLKQSLFISLKNSIADAGSSTEIADILISMLRLNKSYRSGDLQISFYIVANDLYKKYYSLLDPPEKKMVLIEKLKLGLSNKKLVDENSLKILLSQAGITNTDLAALYPLKLPGINSLSEAVAYRLASVDKDVINHQLINADEDEMTFFLIRNLETFINVLNGEEKISLKNGLYAYREIDRAIDLYNHRLPLLSNISRTAPLKNQDILALMIIDDIRYPLAVFNNKFVTLHKETRGGLMTKYINKIATKLIIYNFLAWEALFDATDTSDKDIFKVQRSFEYSLLNFDLLIPMTKEKSYSAHDFTEKTFAGLALNLGVLKGAGDDLIWQYFFSDAAALKNIERSQKRTRINSYDDIIRKAIKLTYGDSPPEVKSKFKGFIQSQKLLFFEVYNKFSSTTGIQKLWELLLARLATEARQPDKAFFEKYHNFYFTGNFIRNSQAEVEFKPDVVRGFNKTFYAEESSLPRQLSNYFKLCSGEEGGNLGINGVLETYRNTDVDYIKAYKKAAISLMLRVFEGRGLEPEQAYIGQMFYDNQQRKIKSIVNSDLYSDDFYLVYDFIWKAARKLADRPELRRLFVEDNAWKIANKN